MWVHGISCRILTSKTYIQEGAKKCCHTQIPANRSQMKYCLSCLGSMKRWLHDETAVSAMIWVDGGVILVLAKISDQNFTAHKIKPTVRWGQEVMPYPDTSHSFPTGHCLSCLGSTKRRLHDKTAVLAMIWVAMVVSFWCLPRFEIKILQEFKRSKIQYGTRIQEVLPYPDTSHSSPMGHCLSCLGSMKRWLHATVYINGDVSTFSLIWNKGMWRIVIQYYLWNLWSLSPIGVNTNNKMKGKSCSYVFVRCLHLCGCLHLCRR